MATKLYRVGWRRLETGETGKGEPINAELASVHFAEWAYRYPEMEFWIDLVKDEQREERG